jgi:hypothetical protein
MMFEFKVNGALSSRQRNFFNLFLPRNLVNLSDVLIDDSVLRGYQRAINIYLTDEAIQELLPKLMSVCVPIQAVRFTERVELLDILGDVIRCKRNGIKHYLRTSQLPATFLDFGGVAFVVVVDSEMQVEMSGDRLD